MLAKAEAKARAIEMVGEALNKTVSSCTYYKKKVFSLEKHILKYNSPK